MLNNPPSLSKIIVGMSGGVDSSVAAYLLKKAGHHVQGVFMKNWEDDDSYNQSPASPTSCTYEKDLTDVQAVCNQLKIDLEIVNFSDEYWERVFVNFLDSFTLGYTPNPDILCNKEIKFTAFLDFARQRGVDYIATGHYARIADKNYLLKGLDNTKDQSYFLHALNQCQLSQSLFPLGHLKKQDVRDLAKSIGLKNHDKKDSTGICFIGERKFKTFLSHYLPTKPGKIKTLEGEEMGIHDGLMFYTIGQRQGLHIGGKKNKREQAWYVANKDLKNNILFVVQGDDHPALYKTNLMTRNIHWINQEPSFPLIATAKTRYRQTDQWCEITRLDQHQFNVNFAIPQRAITPGQSIVFYQDDICLGGGMIER